MGENTETGAVFGRELISFIEINQPTNQQTERKPQFDPVNFTGNRQP